MTGYPKGRNRPLPATSLPSVQHARLRDYRQSNLGAAAQQKNV